MKRAACLLCVMALVGTADAQRLFVGLEGGQPVTRSTDLQGFPNVTYTDHFAFDVSGAAGRVDGTIFLCNGPFTTDLYRTTLAGPPQFMTRLSRDIHSLAYGRGTWWGYSNFSNKIGIYEIDPRTGATTLVVDTTAPGFRFFALDYNCRDELLYGYTEYGNSGLYSIDVETQTMTKIAPPPPNVNGQGRGLAVGNGIVYLTATRGDENEPCFAYDLSQGHNGQWVGFTNPYPNHHSTGGAAWVPPRPAPKGDLNCDWVVNNFDIDPFVLCLTCTPPKCLEYYQRYPCCDCAMADANNDGVVNNFDIDPFVKLLTP